MLIFSFLLDFLLEKFKFPTRTDALLFPGRSGFRAASSGVNLLGGLTLSAKTYWNMQGKTCVPPQTPLTPPPPSCIHSIFKKCAVTSPPFPIALKVTGIFPEEVILQIQMVTTSAPTEVSSQERSLYWDEAAEQRSPPASVSSTTLISPNKYPQKTKCSPSSLSLNY